jgi:hypothetical protein
MGRFQRSAGYNGPLSASVGSIPPHSRGFAFQVPSGHFHATTDMYGRTLTSPQGLTIERGHPVISGEPGTSGLPVPSAAGFVLHFQPCKPEGAPPIHLRVFPTDTVLSLQKQIFAAINVAPGSQRLLFDGEPLTTGTLLDAGVGPGSTIEQAKPAPLLSPRGSSAASVPTVPTARPSAAPVVPGWNDSLSPRGMVRGGAEKLRYNKHWQREAVQQHQQQRQLQPTPPSPAGSAPSSPQTPRTGAAAGSQSSPSSSPSSSASASWSRSPRAGVGPPRPPRGGAIPWVASPGRLGSAARPHTATQLAVMHRRGGSTSGSWVGGGGGGSMNIPHRSYKAGSSQGFVSSSAVPGTAMYSSGGSFPSPHTPLPPSTPLQATATRLGGLAIANIERIGSEANGGPYGQQQRRPASQQLSAPAAAMLGCSAGVTLAPLVSPRGGGGGGGASGAATPPRSAAGASDLASSSAGGRGGAGGASPLCFVPPRLLQTPAHAFMPRPMTSTQEYYAVKWAPLARGASAAPAVTGHRWSK